MKTWNRVHRLLMALAIATIAGISGCSTVSHHVAHDGSAAQQLVWPQLHKRHGKGPSGIYPTQDTLALLHLGMDKGQVRYLIGPPEFGEGFGAREWDYLVHISDSGNSDAATIYHACNLKLLFARGGRVGSIYWEGELCPPRTGHVEVNQPSSKGEVPVTSSVTPAQSPDDASQVTQLLFEFGQANIDGLLLESRDRLEKLVAELRNHGGRLRHLIVDAYADRLGEKAFNQRLSQRRASNVELFLIQRGVVENVVTATGRGTAVPEPSLCQDTLGRTQLIACLEPDRRADIRVIWK